MCNCKHQCTITLSATTSGAVLNLPDSSRIRNGRVNYIALRKSGAATLKNVNGQTLAADTVINTANLRVVNLNGFAICDPIPLSFLQRDANSPEPYAVDWQNVDPTQCVITLDTSAAGYSATAVVEIIFGLDCQECGL
jgi:hypothetical protein